MYPLELYLATEGSDTLPAGVYHYQSAGHQLTKVGDGGPRALLGRLKGMQPWIAAAPAVVLVAGVPARLEGGDKTKALPLTYYEGGAAAQCLLLQASALGLAAGTAAGVDLEAVAKAAKLPGGTQVLTLLPVGREK
jgi:SagB-type dehydrogenase family enzyme